MGTTIRPKITDMTTDTRLSKYSAGLLALGTITALSDGILGPETLRAIRAYERDHNMPAYSVIDRQLLRTLGLG